MLGIVTIRLTEEAATHPISSRQLLYLFVGLVFMGIAALPHPRRWREFSLPLAILVTLALVFVLLPFVPTSIVRPRNGARRWINIVVTDIQPSELAKFAFVLALASYLRIRENYRTLHGLLPPFLIMFVPLLLILVEPDLGTAMLFPVILFSMLLAAGARLVHLGLISILGSGALILVVIVSLAAAAQPVPRYPLLKQHQVERLQGLANQIKGDTRQRDTINYQAFKAMTLVGAGGANGLGEERSRVIVRFNRLPEEHNDMIFAVIANRWGFLGGSVLIGLYLVYILGLIGVGWVTKDPFGRLACVGFATITASQMMVNIGMTIGILPITGMTLPFVSAGGSSLVASFMMTGIALSIGLRPNEFFARNSFEFDAGDARGRSLPGLRGEG